MLIEEGNVKNEKLIKRKREEGEDTEMIRGSQEILIGKE